MEKLRKWMNYRRAQRATAALLIAGAVLGTVGAKRSGAGLTIGGLALMLLALCVFKWFYRCPHCGAQLGRTGGTGYCQQCGKRLASAAGKEPSRRKRP